MVLASWDPTLMDSRQTATRSLDFCPNLCYIKYIIKEQQIFNFSIMSKSLFQQSINLCDDYLGLEWIRGVRTSIFDSYRRENDLDGNLAIYHYGGDRFDVRTMVYNDASGCIVGDQINLGSFDNIYDAQDCAEDYLKDLLLDLGV